MFAGSERRFRTLIEKSCDAITVTDARGMAIYASPSAARILGYRPEEFVGRNLFSLMHPDDLEMTQKRFAELLERPGSTVSAEFRWRHKNGTWRWIEVTGTNLLEDADIRGIVGNYQDVSERKHLEDELRRRMDELEEADRRKDGFLAMLAHELRNRLAPVRNGLEIVKQLEKHDTVIGKTRDIMERQVQHLARLVDDLLDVARITHGKIELRQETTSLAPIVQAAVELSKPLFAERDQEFSVSLPAKPIKVKADATRLEQIVANLLSNAAKFTGQGGHIRLAVRQEGQDIVMAVRDSGVGIAPAMLSRIFEPFQETSPASDGVHGGLGIGLSLVRQLVELHRGTVQASSAGPGKGSEFIVRLPIVVDTQSDAQNKDYPIVIVSAKHRILVVDDNEDASKSLATVLRLEGHDVRVACSAQRALEIARKESFDIVMLDIGMPDMDGYEVAKRLRSQPAFEKVALVAMTGYGQEDDRRRSQEAGFDFHLVKPVEPEALKRVLSRRSGAS